MEKDFYGFDPDEKQAFDRAYKPEEIESFISGGGDDPVEIFKALKAFDFPDTRPEAKSIVLAHFSDSRFAPQINMLDGQNGEVMIYRRNIVPLLRASQIVFWQIFDLFTDDVKASINSLFAPTNRNAQRDWEK